MWRIIALSCFIAFTQATALLPSVHVEPEGRIVGGENAEITQAPWQVSIEVGDLHRCGGSIIHASWVLSAAQCAQFPITTIKIRAGTTLKGFGGMLHNIMEKVIHGRYNSDTNDYDFALFKVAVDFVMGMTIRVVDLPWQGLDTAAGSGATATGWGAMAGGAPTQQLQLLYMPVTSWGTCNTVYANYKYKMTNQMICAGIAQGNLGGCTGDEGGPLVFNSQVVGIYSWTHEPTCGAAGFYSVYGKVSSVRDWIDNTLQSGVGRSAGSSLLLTLCAAAVVLYSLLQEK